MNQNILVIGSAHLDILADYDEGTKRHRDKIGNLKIALGGSAYNIAVNLATNNYEVSIFTALKRNSLSGKLIEESLMEKGVKSNYITYSDAVPESGFVAHRLDGQLMSAVSSTSIDTVELNDHMLNEAIENSSLVIIDCNLSQRQIEKVIETCNRLLKPLMVSSVSESKVERAINAKSELKIHFLVFAINSLEAKKHLNWQIIRDRSEVLALCNFYKAKFVVVTNGKHGFSVFDTNGQRRDYDAPQKGIIPKSTLGAGDAFLAALGAYYVRNGHFDWSKCAEIISLFVTPVLFVEEGTVGASYSKGRSDFSDILSPSINHKEKIDIVVMTVNPIEFTALNTIFKFKTGNLQNPYKNINGLRVWKKELQQSSENGKVLTLLFCMVGTAGNLPTYLETECLIQHFDIKLLILCGIAAGVKKNIQIGSVAIADMVTYYEYQKLQVDKITNFRLAPINLEESRLKDLPHIVSAQEDWRKVFLGELNDSKFLTKHNFRNCSWLPVNWKRQLEINTGNILSGEKLLSDSEFIDGLSSAAMIHKQTLAGEMEGYGFGAACRNNGHMSWLIFRGISDHGGIEKSEILNKKFQFIPALVAASLVKYYLKNIYFEFTIQAS